MNEVCSAEDRLYDLIMPDSTADVERSCTGILHWPIRNGRLDTYLSNGITFPDVGQKCIAHSLALASSLYKPSNVHKLYTGRNYLG